MTPGADPRVRCSHCGVVSEVVGEGALRMARVLEQVGLRLPDKPMTVEEIEAEFRERDHEERARRKTALLVALVTAAALGLVLLLLVLADGAP